MNRTQILLDPELKKALRSYSRERCISVSELIREVMTHHVVDSQTTQVGLSALERLAKRARKGGAKHISQQIDETLYSL